MESNYWYVDNLIAKVRENGEYGEIPSLFGTKSDFLWKTLDVFVCLNSLTQQFRYYDGYHFLASLNDLRVKNKDTCPHVPLSMIEAVMDLFVASIEGIIAQLSWCVALSGEVEIAKKIRSPNILIQPLEGFKPPQNQDLLEIIRVNHLETEWEVYTLGIPGENTVNKLSYHCGETVKIWQG
jgi:hypothetical protein